MSDNKTDRNKLTVFALTWPIMIEIFLHMLLGNADTLMLSQYSDEAVAAVGVTNQIVGMVIIMFGIIAAGTGILVAQYLGAKQKKMVSEVTAVALTVNLVVGLVMSCMLFVFGATFLHLMKLPVELMDTALSYMRIVGGLCFVQALLMTMTTVIRNHGWMKATMYVTIGVNILNVIGNYVFIFGPWGIPILGVKGVALSTAFSRMIGLLILTGIYLKKVNPDFSLKVLFPFPKETFMKVIKIGLPAAGEHFSYNSSQIMITYFIATLGAQALTTKVYVQNIMMFIYLFALAIGQGTQIKVGHLVGAGENEEAYKTCLTSFKAAIIISTGMAMMITLFGSRLLSLFTDNPAIILLGSSILLVTIVLEPGKHLI